MSSILGVGSGFGLVIGALIAEHLGYHWLFWIPLAVTLLAALATWRYVPESPIRAPGRVNWVAAAIMSAGLTLVLIAVAQTTVWGWGSARTLGVLAAGVAVTALWVRYEVRSDEPLVDMRMMRVRGVWTANLAGFLLGAGMYSSFIIFPQYAQLPRSTGFGFGESVVVSSLYLLPAALGMGLLGSLAGRVARRFGSKPALIAGSAITGLGFLWAAVAHAQRWDMLLTTGLLGIGIGLAFSALGNLIVQAVPPQQTGVATAVNTVMRTLGGALGGQLSATFVADNVRHGLPAVSGFVDSYWMAPGRRDRPGHATCRAWSRAAAVGLPPPGQAGAGTALPVDALHQIGERDLFA
jgi:MFS family permease